MRRKDVVFLFNLLQDVNIQRGLIHLVAQETEAQIRFLVSREFGQRDKQNLWTREIDTLATAVGAAVHVYATPANVVSVLQDRAGLLIAASESSLNAHRQTGDAFQVAPSSFLKITLQHGLECVGFLQSREHIMAHGRDITFNADVVCGWLPADRLTALSVSERAKLQVTGPPTLLQPPEPDPEHRQAAGGMVCENMHSVRLTASGDHRSSFMDTFFEFCGAMATANRDVTLRPHPGGQYMLKTGADLPANVTLNTQPMYKVDLAKYRYGISAPSTIVLDMVLAGIPVGVWRDPDRILDAGNYEGLTEISTLEDWLSFERAAREDPAPILARQNAYLDTLGMLTDRDEIYRRFTRLIVNGLSLGTKPASNTAIGDGSAETDPVPARPETATPPVRVLFIANGMLPTLQISFLKPLTSHFAKGKLVPLFLTEQAMNKYHGKNPHGIEAADWMAAEIRRMRPDLIVCCRYSGPHPKTILYTAELLNVPVIYNIDDDLLNVPKVLGTRKYEYHNHPRRLETVRYLLDNAHLVYASTGPLKQRLHGLGIRRSIVEGNLFCTSRLYRTASKQPVTRIGYMGFDHTHDFQVMLPALVEYLTDNPEVEFEIFGAIEKPSELEAFGKRIRQIKPVKSYGDFMLKLASRNWNIGICPLADTDFNTVKSNNKWVEYTACGMATIASRGFMYDDCAGNGRGILVDSDGWREALQLLTDRPDLLYQTIVRAQTHLLLQYSDQRLGALILDIFRQARMALPADTFQDRQGALAL